MHYSYNKCLAIHEKTAILQSASARNYFKSAEEAISRMKAVGGIIREVKVSAPNPQVE